MDMEPLDQLVAFIPTIDLRAAREFYGGVLGLEVVSADDYALVLRSGNADLRITKVETLSPHPFTILGWTVGSIEGAMTPLVERGIEFLRFEGMEQDCNGVWSAPGGAFVSWFRDPDGNTLSLTQLR